MRRLLGIFLLISNSAFALEAVVTVLETPMFKYRSSEAPVVQYLRKGDVIKIHPSIGNRKEFDAYAPAPEKLQLLREKMKNTPEAQDPLFPGEEENTAYIEDEFIPMLDRQGNTVYILSDHIYVYFNDARELEQKVTAKDPTDYRLAEPLPKNYPLKERSGYRGQFLLGFTQPHYESYNYPDEIRTKGYTSPLEMNYSLLRQAKGNYQQRLFVGATFNFRYFTNSYTFEDKRLAEEKGFKLGLGPTISYDAFKGEKNRINLAGTVIVNFLDRLYISQKDASSSDSREYAGYSLAPRFSLQYHRKDIIDEIDFILGTSIEMGAATSFRAKNGGKEQSWWQNLGDDKFTSRTTFTLGGYVGIQSAY